MSNLIVSQINGGPTGVINAIINGNFAVNQRAVSGTVTLAAGAYGHDRWKAGASGCTYTFATTNNVTTLTISAGSLIQVIEGLNLASGTYTLSFTGTSQGKIGAGSFSGSGVTGAAVGGTNLNIEFNTGTLSLVQFEQGSVATPFERRPYGTELALCQRYYYKVQATGDNSTFGIGMATTSTVADCLINFPVSMRTAPSALEQSGTATQYRLRQGGTEITCSAVPSFVFTSTLTTSTVRGTVASGLTAASAIPLRSTSADAYLAWSAEL